MDNGYGNNKNSRRFYKKTTKYVNCMQKMTRPRNFYQYGTEKLVHHSFQISNLHREKYPAVHQIKPESYNCYIVKKGSVKQQRVTKNADYLVYPQEQSYRCKKLHLNKFFITSNYAAKQIHRIIKKKYPPEGPIKCCTTCATPAPVQHNLYQIYNDPTKIPINRNSQPNVCIMNKYSSGKPLIFECSSTSLQLQNNQGRKIRNASCGGNPLQKRENIKKPINQNNIIPQAMHNIVNNVMVYRVAEDTEHEIKDIEEKAYSSMSTCSSSSSTREYYLPAVSGSTDTIHVADVLAKRERINFEMPNSQEDLISKQYVQTQSKCSKHQNKQTSNLTNLSSDSPLNKDVLSLKTAVIKQIGSDAHKKNDQQLLNILKDNSLLPFFSFNNFCKVVLRNRSRQNVNNVLRHTGVQTKEKKMDLKHFEGDFNVCTVENIKNNNIKKEDGSNNRPSYRTVETKNNHSYKLLPLITSPSCIQIFNNVTEIKDSIFKIPINEGIYKPWKDYENKKEIIGRSKFNINYKPSNLCNTPMFYGPQNKIKTEDVLMIMNKSESNLSVHKIPSTTKTPKSSSHIKVKPESVEKFQEDNRTFSSPKPELLENQLNSRIYSSCSKDSFNISKTKFVKLDPFFDKDLKHPKISRLIIPSKILAGESECMIDKEKKSRPDIREYTSSNSKEKLKVYFQSSTKIKERPFEVPSSCPRDTKEFLKNMEVEVDFDKTSSSNEAIFFTDSILYGSNMFQKIKDKFEHLNSKKSSRENGVFQNSWTVSKENFEGKFNKKKEENCESEFSKECLERLANIKKNLEISSENKIKHTKESARSSKSDKMVTKSKKVSTVSSEPAHANYIARYTHENPFIIPKDDSIQSLVPETKLVTNNYRISEFVEKPNITIEKEMIDLMYDNDQRVLLSTAEDEKCNIIYNDLEHSSTSIKLKSLSTKSINKNICVEKSTQVNMYLTDATQKMVDVGIFTEIPEKENCIIDKKPKEVYKKILGKRILLANGQPVILYNSSGYPVTDIHGRLLKNNLGAYLLCANNYDEIIKNKLAVYDCDHLAVGSSCFNPTKVPFVKSQLKITDRCGNPASLFNNLGLPLTDEEGSFLFDNNGKLLVKMDNYNFPVCCSNGSPIYLKNGAMLLSQKYKFIVATLSSTTLLNWKKSENELGSTSDNTSKKTVSFNSDCSDKNSRSLNSSNPLSTPSPNVSKTKNLLNTNYLKNEERQSFFNNNYFHSTEVPELMHDFICNKNKNPISITKFEYLEGIPQSPIPIYDLEGNKLTDENGFPLKNKYGEYMLLLDKNGFAISDSCGGPIFDSSGKQLLLKDMYKMYESPLINYSLDRFIQPEHPYIEQITNMHNQSVSDSSEEEIPLLDLKFESDQNSEPIMNYIKANNIRAYNMNVKDFHWCNKAFQEGNRKARPAQKILRTYSRPMKKKHSIKEDLLFYQTENYEESPQHENSYGSYNEQKYGYYIPCSYERYLYEDNLFEDVPSRAENVYLYGNEGYYYYNHGVSGNNLNRGSELRCTPENSEYVHY